MTLQFFTNYSPETASDAVFQVKQFLKTCGWEVILSSDGISNYGSGDYITTSSTGPNGFNNLSYFTIQQPGSNRQFCFQQGITNTAWRVKYSLGGFNTDGYHPLIDTPGTGPSNIDNNIIWGSGTDLAPVMANLFSNIEFTTSANYKLNIVADGYGNGFYFFCYNSEKSYITTGMLFDPLLEESYDPSDEDPYIIYISGLTNNVFGFELSELGTASPRCWMGKGGADSTAIFNTISALNISHINFYTALDAGLTPSNVIAIPGYLGSSQYTLQDQFFPIVYGRSIYGLPKPPEAIDGYSSLFQNDAYFYGANEVLNVVGYGDNIVFNTQPDAYYTVTAINTQYLSTYSHVYFTPAYTGPSTASDNIGTDYFSANPFYTPPLPAAGYKGISSFMQWIGTTRGSVGIYSINNVGDHIIVNQVALPWNNSTIIV